MRGFLGRTRFTPLRAWLKELLSVFIRQELEEPYNQLQEHLGAAVIQVRACKEICTDHFQAVSARLVATEHQSSRLQCLFDYRNLTLVEFEINDFVRLRFPPRNRFSKNSSNDF